jgi:hypothetical protein
VIFAPIGPILWCACDCQRLYAYYNVLTEYSKSYLETGICIFLPDREECIELNYKGLAFCCFTCGLLYHLNSDCPLEVQPPPAPGQARPQSPSPACIAPNSDPNGVVAMEGDNFECEPDVVILSDSPDAVVPEVIIIPDSPKEDRMPKPVAISSQTGGPSIVDVHAPVTCSPVAVLTPI